VHSDRTKHVNVLFICNEIKAPQQAEEICISNRQQQQMQPTIACSSNLQLKEIFGANGGHGNKCAKKGFHARKRRRLLARKRRSVDGQFPGHTFAMKLGSSPLPTPCRCYLNCFALEPNRCTSMLKGAECMNVWVWPMGKKGQIAVHASLTRSPQSPTDPTRII